MLEDERSESKDLSPSTHEATKSKDTEEGTNLPSTNEELPEPQIKIFNEANLKDEEAGATKSGRKVSSALYRLDRQLKGIIRGGTTMLREKIR